jgi:Tfp pilus assembly protein PilF
MKCPKGLSGRLGIVSLALGVSFGCQQSAPLAPRIQAPPPPPPEKSVTLNGKQVADVQLAMGRSLEKQGAPEQAMAAYREAIKKDPKCGDAYLRLAILNDKQGQFKESEELYRKALEASPGNAEIFCDRGYSYYLQQAWAEAEMNLRQAIVLQAGNQRAHNNLGLVLSHTNRGDEALAEFRRAGCTESEAQVNLAYAMTIDQHWSDARYHYQHAVALDNSSTHAKEGLKELDSFLAKRDAQKQAVAAGSLTPEIAPQNNKVGSTKTLETGKEVKQASLQLSAVEGPK